jgi:hypothetical protein
MAPPNDTADPASGSEFWEISSRANIFDRRRVLSAQGAQTLHDLTKPEQRNYQCSDSSHQKYY